MAKLAELIGNRIKEIRKAKGLRQEDMERFGISYKYYQKIEGGKVNVTLGTIEKIANALEIDARDLFVLPLDQPKEVNELIARINKMIDRKDIESIKKLNMFIREFLE